MEFDAIVIGGSFAGLSAATQLARARRNVLVIDAGKPRNRFAPASHGFLGHDGEKPGDILTTARRQLLAYPTVSMLDGSATAAARREDGFAVTVGDAKEVTGRRLILATGVVDRLPEVPGLQERWGRGVFHCPYCHGYELGEGPIAVLAVGSMSMHQALMLPDWAPTTLFLNESFELEAEQRQELQERGTTLETVPVAEVRDGDGGRILVCLRDGRQLTFAGMFVVSQTEAASTLAADLGCAFEAEPTASIIKTDPGKETSVKGVFACGDAARQAGSVPLAVGDGAIAGVAAHRSLIFKAD